MVQSLSPLDWIRNLITSWPNKTFFQDPCHNESGKIELCLTLFQWFGQILEFCTCIVVNNINVLNVSDMEGLSESRIVNRQEWLTPLTVSTRISETSNIAGGESLGEVKEGREIKIESRVRLIWNSIINCSWDPGSGQDLCRWMSGYWFKKN